MNSGFGEAEYFFLQVVFRNEAAIDISWHVKATGYVEACAGECGQRSAFTANEFEVVAFCVEWEG